MSFLSVPAGHRFVSEPIVPEKGEFDTGQMAAGAPGLPRRFRWRGRTYEVERVIEGWKDTGPCHHGSGERYVRKHWYRVATTDGSDMRIYFDRQPRSRSRWWLASVAEPSVSEEQ